MFQTIRSYIIFLQDRFKYIPLFAFDIKFYKSGYLEIFFL